MKPSVRPRHWKSVGIPGLTLAAVQMRDGDEDLHFGLLYGRSPGGSSVGVAVEPLDDADDCTCYADQREY
jgi:hypothetical protein